ncbi:MAG: aspartoacylase [Kangiellaceae bacterium]|nr:aspartoacylase [Kangiellaceae bacterium]
MSSKHQPIRHVAIVGGTHGNEITGVYLIKKYQNFVELLQGYDFSIELLTANSEAVAANKRYIDCDLNRSFKIEDLSNNSLLGYENQRAKEINQQLGPKGNSRVDFIVDLHTSTAPMGVNLVLLNDDPFHLKLADYVQQRMDNVTITWEQLPDHHFLMSIAPRHILIEVGATPQGSLRHKIFEQTEQATTHVLNFIEAYNKQELPVSSSSLEVYKYFDVMYLPQDSQGNIIGMVHDNIQDRDFGLLKTQDAIFKLFDGSDIVYEGEECYIAFINEAAYYDEKKAFSMAKRVVLSIG